MANRETWATRMGFILAAVGSAVGLGNIWRFPFQTAESGGAAFVLVYLLFVGAIGIPTLLVEFVIGRRAKRNAIGAYKQLGHSRWTFVGVIGILTGFIILSYYSVVAGWVLRYFFDSLAGAYFSEPESYFGSIASGGTAILFHAVFMAVTVAIVAFGIQRGIERGVTFMMPTLFVVLIGLVIYAAQLEGAGEAYDYYLSPNFQVLVENAGSILPAAAGQAFYTLSLGIGSMITYASYLKTNRNLVVDGITITALNTLVSLLMGFVVFPLLFTMGVSPEESGPNAMFVSLATAFANLPTGQLLGAIFFGVATIAALLSSIALLELIVAYLIDTYGITRKVAVFRSGIAMFILGIPPALSMTILGLYDGLISQVVIILSGLLLAVFGGWVFSKDALAELQLGAGDLGGWGNAWLWLVRVPVVVVLVVSLVLGVGKFSEQLRGLISG